MKFPKLKHTILCQLLLYAPGFAFFWYLLLLEIFRGGDAKMRGADIAALLQLSAFSLWYLFRYAAFFRASDALPRLFLYCAAQLRSGAESKKKPAARRLPVFCHSRVMP